MRGWPFFGLEIRTPRLTLRVPDDEDLEALADLASHGIHGPDAIPFSEPWSIGDPATVRLRCLQWHWKVRAELTAESWNVNFGVWDDGVLVGTQGVFAEQYPVRRTATTGSWVGRAFQGKGVGKEMRAAVLHLVFAGLAADNAATGAFADNPASQRVTEALGYEPNGVEIYSRHRLVDGEPSGDEVIEVDHFIMRRAAWEKRRRDDIEIVGLDACLPLLGLVPSS